MLIEVPCRFYTVWLASTLRNHLPMPQHPDQINHKKRVVAAKPVAFVLYLHDMSLCVMQRTQNEPKARKTHSIFLIHQCIGIFAVWASIWASFWIPQFGRWVAVLSRPHYLYLTTHDEFKNPWQVLSNRIYPYSSLCFEWESVWIRHFDTFILLNIIAASLCPCPHLPWMLYYDARRHTFRQLIHSLRMHSPSTSSVFAFVFVHPYQSLRCCAVVLLLLLLLY